MQDSKQEDIEVFRNKVRKVICPVCKVGPSYACKRVNGKPRTSVHKRRIEHYLKLARQLSGAANYPHWTP